MSPLRIHHDRGTRVRRRAGFTLIELLVVITIILIISAAALPTIIPAIAHRQVSEGARILQGALAGARDVAIHTGAPSGIRLLPDPDFLSISPSTAQLDPSAPLVSNRILPLQPAPDYTSGRVSIIKDVIAPFINFTAPPFPSQGGGNQYPYPYPFFNTATTTCSVLMVEECPIDPNTGLPNEPTSWFWNVRIGDKIQIGDAGQIYTVIGPMTTTPSFGNVDMLVNDGQAAGTPPHLQRTYVLPNGGSQTFNVEYLFLVNGLDDNLDGYVDNLWNGVDENANGYIDEGLLEFVEVEAWQGSLGNLPMIPTTQLTGFVSNNLQQPTGALNLPYTIQRRPVPGSNGKEIALPPNVVVDFTSWGNPSPERSRVPALAFDTYNGYVDILVYPNGQLVPSTYFSSPASMGLSSNFIHLWLAERGDVASPAGTFVNGNWSVPSLPSLPIGTIQRVPGSVNVPYNGPQIKGEYRLVSFFARTGQITTNSDVFFDNPANPQNGTIYNPSIPYLEVQQGINGGGR